MEARLYAEIYYSSDKNITISEQTDTTNISDVNNSCQNVLEKDTSSFKRTKTVSNRTNVEDEYVAEKQHANTHRLRSSMNKYHNYLQTEDISRSEMICNNAKDSYRKNRTDIMDQTYTGQSSQSKRFENVTKRKHLLQSIKRSANKHDDIINHSSKSSSQRIKKQSKKPGQLYQEFLSKCFSDNNSNKNVNNLQRHTRDSGSHRFSSGNVNSCRVGTKNTEVSNTQKHISRKDAKKNKNSNKTSTKGSLKISSFVQRENKKNKSVAKHIKFNVSAEGDVEVIHDSDATKGNSKHFSNDLDDSEDSILEVPVPPKPKPPLITLQDSDHDPIESDNDDCVSISSSISDNDVNRSKQTNELVPKSLNSESIPVTDASEAVHTLNSSDETLERNINTNVSNLDTNAHCSESTSSQEISTDRLIHHESMSDTNTLESICMSSCVDNNIQSCSNQDSYLSISENNLRQSSELTTMVVSCNPLDETAVNKDIVEIEEVSQSSRTEQTNSEDQCQDSLILNCTEVQKSVATLTEIREMSGTVQRIQVDNSDSATKSKTIYSTETVENHTYVREKVVDSCDGHDQISENENDTDENILKRFESRRSIEEIQIDVSYDKCNSADESNDIRASLSPVKKKLPGCSTTVSKERYVVTKETVEESTDFSKTKKRQLEHVDNVKRNTKQKKCNDGESEPSGSKTNAKKQKNKNNKNQGIPEEDYFFKPLSNKLKSFYNESWGGESFDLDKIRSEMPRHPRHWAILDDDLMHSSMRKGRYWTSKRCTLCHCDGHTWATCSKPRKPAQCYMCGIEGHSEPRCPQKMCLTCGKKQSSYMKTCESCRKLHCILCNATGHKKSTCPDLWRRYHQTTNASQINVPDNMQVVMKPPHLLNCSNCARRGHDSSTCNKYRWSQHFITPVFVTKYMDDLTGTMHVEYNTLDETSNRNIEVQDEFFTYTENQGSFENHNLSVSNAPSLLSNVDLKNTVKTNIGVASRTSQHYIVFTCGRCPDVKRYKRITRIMNDIDGAILTGLREGRVLPLFLHDLQRYVPFKLQIKCIKKTQFELVIQSTKIAVQGLWKLMCLWIQREDDEKTSVVCKNLSYSKSQMFDFLSSKFKELNQDLGDPITLWRGIQRLKNTIEETQNKGSNIVKYVNCLAKLQCKLVLIHAKSVSNGRNNSVSNLNKLLKKLSKATKINQISVKLYLKSVYIFNKLFTPHTPPQVQSWLNTYYNVQQNVQSNMVVPTCESPTMSSSCQAPMKVYQDESNKLSSFIESSKSTDVATYSYIHDESNSFCSMTNSNSNVPFALATCSTFQTPSNLEIHTTPHGRLVTEITNAYATNVSNTNLAQPLENYYQTSNETDVLLEETYNDTHTDDFRLQNRTLIEIPLNDSTPCESRENLEFDSEKYFATQNNFDSNNAECDDTSCDIVSNRPIQTNSKDEQSQNYINDDVNASNVNEINTSKQNYSNIQMPLASNCSRHSIFNITGSQTKININNHFKTHTKQQRYQEIQLRLQKRLTAKAKKAIKLASTLQQPYIVKAIEQLQEKINTQKLNREHIKVLNRMVMCEKSHQNLMKKMYNE